MSEEDKVKYGVMSMKGGNVVAALTNKAVLVGLIDKELPQGGTSKLQNLGDLTQNVLNLAKTLYNAGY